jgi:formate-dependent nitrite reductase membrane component NrfD
LAAHGQVNPRTAAISAVLACIASAAINLPIVYRTMKDRKLFRRYLVLSSITTFIGLLALAAVSVMRK